MNQEIMQLLPEAATLVGAIGGYAVTSYALRRAAESEASVVENLGPISQQEDLSVERSKSKIVEEFIVQKVAPTAIAAASLGIFPMAWLSNEAPKGTLTPTLQEVIDYSGQTAYDGGSNKEHEINKSLIGMNKMDVNVTLGVGGSFQEGHISAKSIQNVNKYKPIGITSMPIAFNVALGNSVNSDVPVQSNVIGANKNKSGAILVVTDDDPIGSVSNVVAMAKQDSAKVFIANVGDQTDSDAKDLQLIAKETGGKYWNANSNTSNVANKIVSDITPAGEKIPNANNNDWKNWLKVLDVGSALAFVGITLNSAKYVFKRNKDSKGE